MSSMCIKGIKNDQPTHMKCCSGKIYLLFTPELMNYVCTTMCLTIGFCVHVIPLKETQQV